MRKARPRAVPIIVPARINLMGKRIRAYARALVEHSAVFRAIEKGGGKRRGRVPR